MHSELPNLKLLWTSEFKDMSHISVLMIVIGSYLVNSAHRTAWHTLIYVPHLKHAQQSHTHTHTPNLHLNFLDLEPQDDDPDQAQEQSWSSVHNILGTNVLQVHLLALEKLNDATSILNLVDPKSSMAWMEATTGNKGTSSLHTDILYTTSLAS